jgi:hypothetical protein
MERDTLLDAGATSNAVAHRTAAPPLSAAVATDSRLVRGGLPRNITSRMDGAMSWNGLSKTVRSAERTATE